MTQKSKRNKIRRINELRSEIVWKDNLILRLEEDSEKNRTEVERLTAALKEQKEQYRQQVEKYERLVERQASAVAASEQLADAAE